MFHLYSWALNMFSNGFLNCTGFCITGNTKVKLLVGGNCIGVKNLTFTCSLTQIEHASQAGINLLDAVLNFVISQPNIDMAKVDANMNQAINNAEMKLTSDATFSQYLYDGDGELGFDLLQIMFGTC